MRVWQSWLCSIDHIRDWDIRQPDIAFRLMDKSIYSRRQERLQQLLRDVRSEAGLRQVDLAERLGQPQSFVSKYESGERRLDVLELLHVCECCGITLSDFMHRFTEGGR